VILYAFSRALKIRGSRNYRTGSKSNYRRKGPVPPPVHNRPTSSEVEGCGLASPLGGESEASHDHPTQGGVDPSGKREGAEPHTWAGCIVTWEMQTQLGHNSPFGQAGCGLMTDRPAPGPVYPSSWDFRLFSTLLRASSSALRSMFRSRRA
jgi:hypothetical protein